MQNQDKSQGRISGRAGKGGVNWGRDQIFGSFEKWSPSATYEQRFIEQGHHVVPFAALEQ